MLRLEQEHQIAPRDVAESITREVQRGEVDEIPDTARYRVDSVDGVGCGARQHGQKWDLRR